MPTPALLLLIATFLPLVGFALLMLLGRRIGNPLSGWVATFFISISFVCTIGAMVGWFTAEPGHYQGSEWGEGWGPINIPLKWIPVGLPGRPGGISQDHPSYLDLGLYVDSLTIAMFAMIALAAVLVHVFSIGYLRDDARFDRFFAFLSLLCFAMLAMVLGGTLLHILIFWELVGVCSYLLIGFWYESRAAYQAAVRAVAFDRIGNIGFLLAFGILFYHMGNVSLPALWTYLGSAGDGRAITLPGGVEFSAGLLTIVGIGLFFGAIARSAQFPLQVWLADTTAAPSPANAILQSATTIAAGVYLIGRVFPILTPSAKLFIAIIGLITLTMSALIATAQDDIKRLLAYCTISQVGYMMLAIGIGSWVGALFHLMTHAFIMTLLLLGAGSVIHATAHEHDMTRFGGLWRKMPMTAFTSGIAVLAIAGTPWLSAWVSRTIILTDAAAFTRIAGQEGHKPAYALFFILPAVVSYLTAFYMARWWMLIFWGKPRDAALHESAREFPLMWAPLCALTFMVIVSGKYLNVEPLLESSIKETQAICRDYQLRDDFFELREDFPGFKRVWPTNLATDIDDPLVDAVQAGGQVERRWMHWGFLIGLALAFLIYIRGYAATRLLLRVPPARWIDRWLMKGMYFDQLYVAVIFGTIRALAKFCDWFDRRVIDGSLNRMGSLARRGIRRAGLLR